MAVIEQHQNEDMIEGMEDHFQSQNVEKEQEKIKQMQMETAKPPIELSKDSNKESTPFASVIGSPLQASSPTNKSVSNLRKGEGGDGDAHPALSIQAMLSPIHRARACHQFNLANDSVSESFTDTPAPLERLLRDIEKNSMNPAKRLPQPNSLQQELILTEKISKMDESEAKKFLAKVVRDNMDLRQELRSKEKRITAFKGQMLAILEWKAKQEMDAFSEGSSCTEDSQPEITSKSLNLPRTSRKGKKKTMGQESDSSGSSDGSVAGSSGKKPGLTSTNNVTHEVTLVEEVFGMRRSLSFIQELASSIDVDQEMLRLRIKDGCYLTNQLLLGSVSGWLSALFVKKFGKLALSAAGGGLLLLVYTTRKGYVNVNYDSIYQEISRLCDYPTTEYDKNNGDDVEEHQLSRICSSIPSIKETNSSDGVNSLNKTRSQENTTWDKIHSAKRWISSHSYTVGGFVLTFIYNVV